MKISERILLVCQEFEGGNMSRLAKNTGVTPAYISKLKNKPDSNPSGAFIKNISQYYGVNENWLLTGEGSMRMDLTREDEIAQIAASVYTDDDNFRLRLIKVIAGLKTDQLKVLKDIAEALAKED